MIPELSYTDDARIDELIECERNPHRKPHVRITGLMVQYYHVCKRELWFMSRGIDIDRDTANIQRGSHVDETSYRDNRRSFTIDGRISLDVLDDGDIMEVKVSSALEEPPRMQLLYYLWYLDRIHGVEKSGVLAYPKERTREAVELDQENAHKLESTLVGILDVVEADSPPPLKRKPYCDSCLYQDICWV